MKTGRYSAYCFMAAVMMILANGLAFSAQDAAKPANDPGKGELVDKTESLKQDFHPKLKHILNVKDDAEIGFLKVLNEEEQLKLADLVQSNIDSSSSLLLQRMAFVSNFFPAFLLGKFAPQAGPEMAARLSYYVSPKRNVAIAKHTRSDFLAESVYFLEPAKVMPLMEETPDSLLIEVSEHIVKKGDYYIMAEFADQLSLKKAISLVKALDKAEVMVNVGYYMKNVKLLGDVIAALPAEHVNRLVKEVIDLGYYEISAKLSQRLEPDRIIMMLEKVDPVYVANVAIHYPPELTLGIMEGLSDEHMKAMAVILAKRMTPEQIAMLISHADPRYFIRIANHYPPELAVEIMEKVGDQHMQEITAKLTDETAASFMNQLPPGYVNHLWNKFPREIAERSLPYVDLDRLKTVWGELSPEVKQYIRELSPAHKPLADMLKTL